MRSELYPLTMAFPSSKGPINLIIDRSAWKFCGDSTARYSDLPIRERLAIRQLAWAQVDLANDTPKGER